MPSSRQSIAAAFIMCFLASATAVFAQNTDIPGAPEQLFGKWGSKPKECRSWNREQDGYTAIDSETWLAGCSGTACTFSIESHRKLKDGFLLKMRSHGTPGGWTDHIRILSADKFEVLPRSKGDNKETYTRCADADAVAGIGLDNDYDYAPQENTVAFAGYYAKAVPKVCQLTAVDEDMVAAMTAVRGKLTPDVVKRIQSDAESAVNQDAKTIDEFCIEVFGAFGKKGTITPNLLKDLRKKDAAKTP